LIVKKETFDKERKYQLYELKSGNYLLLYRVDGVDDMINELDIFGEIKYDNIGSEKHYGNKYKEFKDNICFTDNYLETQLNNDIMKFFYTESEINNFIKKYKR